MMLANMVLHDRVPAGEAVLVAKTLEDALRGVPLLAMVLLAIPPQPLVDESGNSSASQLRRASDGAPALCVGTPAGRRTRASSSRSRVRPRNGAPPRARSSRPGTPDAPCDTAPRCESSHPPHDRKGLTLWQSFAPPRRDHPAATMLGSWRGSSLSSSTPISHWFSEPIGKLPLLSDMRCPVRVSSLLPSAVSVSSVRMWAAESRSPGARPTCP